MKRGLEGLVPKGFGPKLDSEQSKVSRTGKLRETDVHIVAFYAFYCPSVFFVK